jgi:Nidogen-like/VPDSG-CTERM motif
LSGSGWHTISKSRAQKLPLGGFFPLSDQSIPDESILPKPNPMNPSTLRCMVVGMLVCAKLTIVGSGTTIRTDSGFTTNILPAMDDGSSGPVSLGFDANFFGTTYSSLSVNNNGYVSFGEALSTFTPFNILPSSSPVIAPFLADVDTTYSSSVTYGTSMIDGRMAFGVNWVDVGKYSALNYSPLNSFQLVLIDRSDIGVGDFDIEFNYGSINWDTGDGSLGLSARVGWSNGSTASYELDGSGVSGAFIDGGQDSLLTGAPVLFSIRNGGLPRLPDSPKVPDSGSSVLLLGAALLGFEGARRQLAKV